MNWLTDKRWQIAFGVPFKNGYNSIRKILNDNLEPVRIPKKFMKTFPRLVFVTRHPIERFLSLWRSKCRDHESGPGVERLTKEELFTRIETGLTDPHWQRQVDMLSPYQGRAETVRLENMPAWWAKNMGGEYPHEHRTKPDDTISAELFEKVTDYYADDFGLYYASS